VVRFP